jgi:hypothetical protein
MTSVSPLTILLPFLFLHMNIAKEIDAYCDLIKPENLFVDLEREEDLSSNPFFDDSHSKIVYDRSSSQETASGSSRIYIDDLDQKNRKIIIKQMDIFRLFNNTDNMPIQTIYSCKRLERSLSGNPGHLILNFQAFYEIREEVFQKRYYQSEALPFRIKIYIAAAMALKTVHAKQIVLCNLNPSTIGSSDMKYSPIIFRDLVYAQDVSLDEKTPCPKFDMTSFPKDVHHPRCFGRDNIKKADIWALAMIILQIEMQYRPMSSTFLLDEKSLRKSKCYSDEWTPNCDFLLSEFIKQIFNQSHKSTSGDLSILRSGLEEVVHKMTANCEDRLSADELVEALGELSILEIGKKNMQKEVRPIVKVKPNHDGLFTSMFGGLLNCCSERDNAPPPKIIRRKIQI